MEYSLQMMRRWNIRFEGESMPARPRPAQHSKEGRKGWRAPHLHPLSSPQAAWGGLVGLPRRAAASSSSLVLGGHLLPSLPFPSHPYKYRISPSSPRGRRVFFLLPCLPALE
ncbi:hypothetical protein PVAP13_4KG387103 [Panicum virgatum]|uniref:Uncharacterized protein n=1 Tax=Panicum virgatum TaxID=38727 RepID=A0A8T0TWG5_PANVG|nr:hypothetical protein PVAP13_4KG387103 [Panicum virgatum]